MHRVLKANKAERPDHSQTKHNNRIPQLSPTVDFHDLENFGLAGPPMYVKSVFLVFLFNQSALRPAISGVDLASLASLGWPQRWTASVHACLEHTSLQPYTAGSMHYQRRDTRAAPAQHHAPLQRSPRLAASQRRSHQPYSPRL